MSKEPINIRSEKSIKRAAKLAAAHLDFRDLSAFINYLLESHPIVNKFRTKKTKVVK